MFMTFLSISGLGHESVPDVSCVGYELDGNARETNDAKKDQELVGVLAECFHKISIPLFTVGLHQFMVLLDH